MIRKELTRREVLLAALGGCLIAVAMHWPLVLNLGDTIPKDLGDPLPQSWQVAWGGHAIEFQPLDFFQSNQFWPVDDSLAFGDALIGYAPAGLLGEGPFDAVVRYDLLFLFAYALAFFGAYLLARELGIGPAGAAVAGAAFAFAPFRLEQDGHMQVISSGGIPLCLALFVRGFRLRRAWPLFAGWLAAAWQLSLGFALGLPLAYMLGAGVLAAIVVWFAIRRPPLDRRLVLTFAWGAIVFVAVAALIARPYFRVADEHPEAKRPPSTVEAFSGPVSVFLTAPDENWLWAEPTEGIREDLENVPEKTLFPGALILALALLGLFSSSLDRRLRIGLGAGAVGISVLALGFQEDEGYLWPYRALYEFLPGWEGIRTPGRLVTFSSLALAILAAAGSESIMRVVRRRLAVMRHDVGPAGVARASAVIAGVLVAALLVEGRGLPFDPMDEQDQPTVPDRPISTAEVADPQLHLPAERPEDNRRYLLWSTAGFPDVVNGRASTEPELIEDVIEGMDSFPDPPSVALLLDLGVESVVLHTDRVEGTPQEDAAEASIAELPLSRERLSEDLIVYRVGSTAGSGAGGDAGSEGGSAGGSSSD